MRLQDKIAIVTGAGQGIGFGIAARLREAGADVVVADVNAATADPAFYRRESTVVSRQLEELRVLEAELETAYGRWEELEGRER